LAQHHSDLLFRLRLKTGDNAFAYILLEHKSSPDPGAPLQLLRYIVRILTRNYHENKKRLPLAPVIPLLAHHGPEGWTISCEFGDLFGAVPESMRPYLVSYRHALVDLVSINDAELSAHLRLRAFLKALKYGLRRLIPDREETVMVRWTDEYEEKGLKQGLQQGHAKSLARLLERRFGVVPPQYRESIFSAGVASVEMWFERAIDAPDLKSVFEAN
jgi:hypothetical protein